MLAYSTTKPHEDGQSCQIHRDAGDFASGRRFERLEGGDLRRHSKLARNEMGDASAATVIVNRPGAPRLATTVDIKQKAPRRRGPYARFNRFLERYLPMVSIRAR